MRNYQKKQRETKCCEQCGGTFSALKCDARFCSAKCCSKSHYADRKFHHKCIECGSDFLTRNANASVCGPKCELELAVRAGHEGAKKNSFPRKHASRADAYKIYDYQRRTAVASRQSEIFSSDEIFERDGWLCQICGDEIDRDLVFPHPRSVSLDHVRPISRGGKHVRSNVQCAHLGCNSKKGATYFAEAVG